MFRQIFPYVVLITFFPLISSSQEVVTGLWSNYGITKYRDNRLISKAADTDTLLLPFFEDFSGTSVFPDKKRWLDDFVFINNTYSERQITKGVATFDALDNYGRLYEASSPSGFKADQLTSRPVNLNYPSSSNIWLSFLFERGGLSDNPEPNDSLTLQFFAPDENAWYSVWKINGSIQSQQGFKTVNIPVKHERYLKNGFKFRFTNYASMSPNLSDPSMAGNCDIWNIDYLMLDINRNEGDTIFADVAFRLPVRSLLKNHESIPWKQFKQVYLQEMGSSIPIHYRNNDSIVRNITRDFVIKDVYKNAEVLFFTAGATNINPISNVDYNANLIYTFDTENSDSALFKITCSLKTDEFDPKENDTLIYYQVFKNYFAFDDGSAEGGYGINGLGSRNAMLAYRFTSYLQDTLRAISICFNDSYLDANKRAFDIMVWDDNNGFPGNVIYSKEEVMVEQGELINGFYNYMIPDEVMVEGVFYVGWKQRSETFLNAGFDINTPNRGKQFFWLNGSWNQSQFQGSVMIRPVVGYPLNVTALNDTYIIEKEEILIWPNPARDHIKVRLKENTYTGSAYITIIDLKGNELLRAFPDDEIDISSLHEGLYIVITNINGKRVGYNRLIKSR